MLREVNRQMIKHPLNLSLLCSNSTIGEALTEMAGGKNPWSEARVAVTYAYCREPDYRAAFVSSLEGQMMPFKGESAQDNDIEKAGKWPNAKLAWRPVCGKWIATTDFLVGQQDREKVICDFLKHENIGC
jgi:hypothetical protein